MSNFFFKQRRHLLPRALVGFINGWTGSCPWRVLGCLGNAPCSAVSTVAIRKYASIITGLPFLECLESPKQFLGKKNTHLCEMGDDLGVGQTQMGCKLEKFDHVLRRAGCWHEFQHGLGIRLHEAAPVF